MPKPVNNQYDISKLHESQQFANNYSEIKEIIIPPLKKLKKALYLCL